MKTKGVTVIAEAEGQIISRSIYPVQNSVYKEQINTCKKELINEFANKGVSKEKITFNII